MSEVPATGDGALVPSKRDLFVPQPLDVVRRALDDLETRAVTNDEISQARLDRKEFQGLSNSAIRIALERHRHWEYRFFAQVLGDEIRTSLGLRHEYSSGVASNEPSECVRREHTGEWVLQRFRELTSLVSEVPLPFNEQHMEEAFGAPGQSGNIPALIHLARQLGTIYRRILEWSLRVMRVDHDPAFKYAFKEMARLTSNTIDEFEHWALNMSATIEEAILAPDTGSPRRVKLTLVLTPINSDGFMEEFRAAWASVGMRVP